MKTALGITGRQLTPTETRYINSWLDMGFDIDTLLEAYDRTVTKHRLPKVGLHEQDSHQLA